MGTVGTLLDFDLAVLILRVLEGWELGNSDFYRKYFEKIQNIQNFILVPGVQKNDFYDFSGIFTRKIWNTGISSETTIPGISSEPTETLKLAPREVR